MDYASGNYVFLGEGIQSLTGYLPAELTGPYSSVACAD